MMMMIGFLTENKTCLVDFFISKQTLTPGELFYRAIYLEPWHYSFTYFEPSDCLAWDFNKAARQ